MIILSYNTGLSLEVRIILLLDNSTGMSRRHSCMGGVTCNRYYSKDYCSLRAATLWQLFSKMI